MAELTRIDRIGASGSLGAAVLKALIEGSFKATVLVHSDGRTAPELLHRITEVVVDFDSESSLVSALTRQDTVVSTVGTTGLPAQAKIIKVAIAAGVRRFIPSKFGSDLKNPPVRQSQIYVERVKIEDLLEQNAANETLSYTAIYNNLYLD